MGKKGTFNLTEIQTDVSLNLNLLLHTQPSPHRPLIAFDPHRRVLLSTLHATVAPQPCSTDTRNPRRWFSKNVCSSGPKPREEQERQAPLETQRRYPKAQGASPGPPRKVRTRHRAGSQNQTCTAVFASGRGHGKARLSDTWLCGGVQGG